MQNFEANYEKPQKQYVRRKFQEERQEIMGDVNRLKENLALMTARLKRLEFRNQKAKVEVKEIPEDLPRANNFRIVVEGYEYKNSWGQEFGPYNFDFIVNIDPDTKMFKAYIEDPAGLAIKNSLPYISPVSLIEEAARIKFGITEKEQEFAEQEEDDLAKEMFAEFEKLKLKNGSFSYEAFKDKANTYAVSLKNYSFEDKYSGKIKPTSVDFTMTINSETGMYESEVKGALVETNTPGELMREVVLAVREPQEFSNRETLDS